MAARTGVREETDETIQDFMRRRARETTALGEQAAAAARDAYGKALRAGENLNLPKPSDVLRHGVNLFSRRKADERSEAHGDPWLDRSPKTKAIAGDVVRTASIVPGVARGARRTANGAVDGAIFLSRLFDPSDAEHSPRGEAAWDKVFQGAGDAIHAVQQVATDPQAIVTGAKRELDRLDAKLNPKATPQAKTFADELRRNVDLGLNQGELLFDVGSLLYGGAGTKALTGIGKATKAEGAAKYLAKGVPTGVAEYFATPYKGIGHHYLPQRATLPPWLGGGPIPSSIKDSPLFLLKPKGISTGDMYELHVRVDPKYHGGKAPKPFGGGRWSGKELGWEKYGRLGRLWYGAPGPMKAVGGAGVIGVGAAVDQFDGEERPR